MAVPSVTLTGKIADITGSPLAGNVILTLVNYGGDLPTVVGTEMLAPESQVVKAADDGTFSVTFYGNYQITPGNTYYTVSVCADDSMSPINTVAYVFNAPGTFDLASLVPLSSDPSPVTVADVGGADWANKPAFMAQASIRYAHTYLGSDVGAMINAAVADLPPTGGTVDARGFTGNVTFSTPVVLGASRKPVQFIADPATTFIYTGTGNAFTIASFANRSSIEGLHLVCSNPLANDGILVDGVWFFTIENVVVNGATNAGIHITNASGIGCYLFSVKDCVVGDDASNPNGIGLLIDSTTVAGITFGQFYNVYCSLNVTDGCQIKGSYANMVQGTQFVGGGFCYNQRHGLYTEGPVDVLISASDFESNGYVCDNSGNVPTWPSSGKGGWGFATDGNAISVNMRHPAFSSNQAGEYQTNCKKFEIDAQGVHQITSTTTTQPVAGVGLILGNGANVFGTDCPTVPLMFGLTSYGGYLVEGSKTAYDFPAIRFATSDHSQWFGWQADALNRLWFFNNAKNLVVSPNWSVYADGTNSVTLPAFAGNATLPCLEGDQTFTGTNRFNASVGIGGAPANILHVFGDAVRVSSTSQNENLWFSAANNSGYAAVDVFNNGNTSKLNLALMPWGGNVGIGKTNPGYLLDVAGTINATDIKKGGTSLATVATSGSYNDLSNKPTIPTLAWGNITGTLSSQSDLNTALSAKVPTTTTVNGHSLSGNVTVTASDVGNGTAQWNANQIQGKSVDSSAPATGDVLTFDGTNWVHTKPVSSLVNQNNSLVNWNATTTSVTVSVPSQPLFHLDGSLSTITGGSQTMTGLSAYATYYVYPYWNDQTNSVGFVSASDITSPTISSFTFGGSGYLTATNSSASPNASFLLECWFKTTASGSFQTLVGMTDGQTGYTSQQYPSLAINGAGNIVFYIKTAGGTTYACNSSTATGGSSQPYNDGQWHHMVAALDTTLTSNQMTLYIDGVQMTSSPTVSTITPASFTGWWHIAGVNNGNFNGSISNVAVYIGKTLTQTQVLNHLKNGVSGSMSAYNNCVIADAPTYYWQLQGPYTDQMGTGNTMTVQGTAPSGGSSNVLTPVGTYCWTTRSALLQQATRTTNRVPLANFDQNSKNINGALSVVVINGASGSVGGL